MTSSLRCEEAEYHKPQLWEGYPESGVFLYTDKLPKWVFMGLLIRGWGVRSCRSAAYFVLYFKWCLCIVDEESAFNFYHNLYNRMGYVACTCENEMFRKLIWWACQTKRNTPLANFTFWPSFHLDSSLKISQTGSINVQCSIYKLITNSRQHHLGSHKLCC